MDTTSNAVGGIRETAIRKKKKDRWRKKESTGEVPCGQTMWSYPAENFRDSQLRTYTEGTSSFVPSARGTARLKIGHLPDEIEDLRRWFAGYYRRSVRMKGKKDQGARGGIRTGDDGEVEVRRGKKSEVV